MTDESSIIENTIASHHDIKERVKQTGDSLTDVEALFMLRQSYSTWTQASQEELASRRMQLLQALNTLEQGLIRHFSGEEKHLTNLYGAMLMKAIIHEHKGILKQIARVRQFITDLKLEGLEQQQVFAMKNDTQEAIHRLFQLLEDHSAHEETVLKMMKASLQAPEENAR
jgi:hemerythrin